MLLPRRYTGYQFKKYLMLMLILKNLERELLPDRKEQYDNMSKAYIRKMEELESQNMR